MTTEAAAPQSTWAEHEQYKKPWYWYDWANSAFVTTVGTVLFAPYLTTVAKEAACPGLDEDASCHVDLHVVLLDTIDLEKDDIFFKHYAAPDPSRT